MAEHSLVLGCPVDCLSMEETLELVRHSILNRIPLHIGVVNAAKLVNMMADTRLRDSVLGSDIILADGMSVVWASKLNKHPVPERIAGVDLMHKIFALRIDKRPIRFFLLGAKDSVVSRVKDNVASDYPHAEIVAFRNGYFREDEEASIAKEIQATNADVLFLAMTSPKKENFMDHWSKVMQVPVVHGVGGSFDVYAGAVSRAPRWMQKSGLEWLHRLAQEPGRLWKRYLSTNARFIYAVACEQLRKITRANQ